MSKVWLFTWNCWYVQASPVYVRSMPQASIVLEMFINAVRRLLICPALRYARPLIACAIASLPWLCLGYPGTDLRHNTMKHNISIRKPHKSPQSISIIRALFQYVIHLPGFPQPQINVLQDTELGISETHT